MSRYYRDLLVVLLLSTGAACASWRASELAGAALDVRGHSAGGHEDVWFDADVRDVHRRLTTEDYEQTHTVRHPLVPLIVRVPMRLYLRAVPGSDAVSVIRTGLAAIAALWAALFFATLRIVGCRTFDAALFSLLGVTSAASLFSFSVAETFALGSITVLAALAVVAAAQRWVIQEWMTTVVTALTVSVTITNGLLGSVMAVLLHPRRRVIQILANAACIVLVLWGIQRYIYPSSGFPYGYDRSYRGFILASDMRTPVGPLTSFLFHSMVMPAVTTIQRTAQENYLVLSVQRSRPGSGSGVGVVALIAWVSLLLVGGWSLFSASVPPRFRAFLIAALGSQLVLHLVFGEETLLYAMHFLPLLLVVGALGVLTRARPAVLGLATVLLVSGAVNNVQQFSRSLELARQITSQIAP